MDKKFFRPRIFTNLHEYKKFPRKAGIPSPRLRQAAQKKIRVDSCRFVEKIPPPFMLYKTEVYKIIGAAMEVYNVLGPGFLEQVYHEALEVELGLRGIPYKSQCPLPVRYKGRQLAKEYIADLICYERIIVELKAVNHLTKNFQAQLLNYLKASQNPLGLLINFGNDQDLEWKRMVL